MTRACLPLLCLLLLACAGCLPRPLPRLVGQPEAVDALAEVNVLRAARGLAPFSRDEHLTQAAQHAASYRAQHLLAGHTHNDFQFLPAGSQADATGCAAWPPDWGWGACCTFDSYRTAGAAYALGRDGRRYMHLYVRR